MPVETGALLIAVAIAKGKLSQVPLQVCLFIDMLVPACVWISLL